MGIKIQKQTSEKNTENKCRACWPEIKSSGISKKKFEERRNANRPRGLQTFVLGFGLGLAAIAGSRLRIESRVLPDP